MTLTEAPIRPAPPPTTSPEELWNRLYPALAGWCKALTGDTDLAHDVASEAFVRLLARWRDVRDPQGYLYVTATNLIRDQWRHQARERKLVSRLADRSQQPSEGHDPWLRDLVDGLPHRLVRPVLLYYFADLSVAQISAALHRPQGTIKRMLSEGRKQLRPLLDGPETSTASIPAMAGWPTLEPSATLRCGRA
jgi:RNA polymerase sigma-70 factor (ECF subfamily)